MPPLRAVLLALVVAAVVVSVDLLTKRHAAANYVFERLTVIPDVLWFTFTENSGASFSMLQDAGPFLSLAAFVAIGFVLWALRTPRPRLEVFGFGLVIGGAAGNLVDRLARGESFFDGHVIDWIQVPSFPVFNIADSAITVAVVLLLIHAWRHDSPRRDGPRPAGR
jgi:signal peptidase II